MRSNHEREARVIYLLITARQTVTYYSTIHILELIYFDSNTQETIKKAVVSFRFFKLSVIAPKKSRQRFNCNASVYMYLLRL